MERSAKQILEGKTLKKICRKIGTTMRDHNMIEEGDHILVGFSGGKDSMIMLEALTERKKALPFDFNISAAHIAAPSIGYRIDNKKLTAFCHDLGVPLHLRIIEPMLREDSEKATCFVCSWNRRKSLFSLTRELNCNKLALGHHRKDAVETLLLNMIYHGSISSIPYKLKMFDGRIELIRPMMDLDERLLMDYANMKEFIRVEKSCPHENRTKRAHAASLLEEIEKIHGKGPYNIFKSMGKVFEAYLPI